MAKDLAESFWPPALLADADALGERLAFSDWRQTLAQRISTQ